MKLRGVLLLTSAALVLILSPCLGQAVVGGIPYRPGDTVLPGSSFVAGGDGKTYVIPPSAGEFERIIYGKNSDSARQGGSSSAPPSVANPNDGTLVITSTLAGTIYVDGEKSGKIKSMGRLQLEVLNGVTEVKIVYGDNTSDSMSLMLAPGGWGNVDFISNEQKVSLAEQQKARTDAFCTITISTIPPHADIVLDGRPVGRSDIKLTSIDPGLHHLQISRKSYATISEDINTSPAENKVLNYEMVVAYEIGDTGPAGGIIFSDAGPGAKPRYAEAAPTNQSDGTSQGEAERLCKEFRLNGFSDWRLPSYDELKLLHKNLYERGLGSFVKNNYWSSTSYTGHSSWDLSFGNPVASGAAPNYNSYAARAIRTF